MELKPFPWEIPTEAQLASIESLLTTSRSEEEMQDVGPDRGELKVLDLDLFEESKQTKWFFSAVG